MDDVERAVDDGVNTYKALTRVSILGIVCHLSFFPHTFSLLLCAHV